MKKLQLGAGVILISAITGWGGYFAGVYRAEGNLLEPEVSKNFVIAQYEKNKVTISTLPESLKNKVTENLRKYKEDVFLAKYNFYRSSSSVLQAYLVSEWIKEEARRLNISENELSKQKLSIRTPSDEEVKQLFLASDPTGSDADFETIKPNLKAYVEEVSKREAYEKLYEELSKSGKINVTLKKPENKEFKLTAQDFPKYGASDKKPVVAFVDYFCDNCAEYNVAIAELAQKYSGQAQFTFVPFPYSRPDKSLGLARGALCAHQQGKYMDYHMNLVSLGDKAVQTGPLAIAQAAQLNLLDFALCFGRGEGVADLLRVAQTEANRAGVLSTPVTYLNGKPFLGKEALPKLEMALKESSMR